MSTAAPFLGETYTLTELPRIPGLPLHERVVVAESQKLKSYEDTETIDLGISKLIISSYVLKPTPKLCWSYPLSPDTVVDSMDVAGDLYVFGLTERKKHRLQLVQRTSDESPSTVSIDLPKAACAVKLSSRNQIYILLQNGDLLVATHDTQDTLSINLAKTPTGFPTVGTRTSLVVYSCFIAQDLVLNKNELLFYIIGSKSSSAVTYRLLALDGSKSFEIYLSSSTKDHGGHYSYIDGTLYHLDAKQRTLSARPLMKPHDITRQISLANILQESSTPDLCSLHAVALDRLLLSAKSSVYLINFKFESLLSKHTNHSGNQVHLGFALPVKGNSQDSRHSFALYLNIEDQSKLCKLKLIHIDVGLNLLSESLGKALNTSYKPAKWNGVPALESDDLQKANKLNVDTMALVYKKLQKAQKDKKAKEFNKVALSFLKGSEQSSKASPSYSKSGDVVVDHKYINLILALVFELDQEGSVQLLDEKFLPESTIGYLLTHPLYPRNYVKGLLILFSALGQPQLLKTAITSCKVMTIDELMVEFTNLMEVVGELEDGDEEELKIVSQLLELIIDRLLQDFSSAQITSKMLEVFSSEHDTDTQKLERMLGVLTNMNTTNSWKLISAVIDVGGLFNWSQSTVAALSELINAKVETLAQNSFNLTLVNQAILSAEVKNMKKTKKPAAKVIDNIHEISNQRAQLDAILTISNNTTNKKLVVDDALELSKQVPVYSRERLILGE